MKGFLALLMLIWGIALMTVPLLREGLDGNITGVIWVVGSILLTAMPEKNWD